jgi:hypothetical protein
MSQGVEKTYHAINWALGTVIITLLFAVGGLWVYENFPSFKKGRDNSFTATPGTGFQMPTNFEFKAPNGQDWAQWHQDQQIQMQKNIRAMMENYQNTQRQLNSYQSNDYQYDR